MTVDDFNKHLSILKAGPFQIFPQPDGVIDNEFKLLEVTETHLKLGHTRNNTERYLAISLVETINPGKPRLLCTRRKVHAYGTNLV